MKLSGNKNSGRHLQKNVGNGPSGIGVVRSNELATVDAKELSRMETGLDPYANAIDIPFVDVNGTDDSSNHARSRKRKKRPKRVFRFVLLGLAILAVAAITAVALDLFAGTEIIIQPPPVNQQPRPGTNRPNNDPDDPDSSGANPIVPGDPGNARDNEKYTFLILGIDEEGSNSDVIMVATFDTSETRTKTLNVVSIPRDTLVNVSWNLKLVNSIYPVLQNSFRSESDRDKREILVMDAMVEKIADLIGFEVDNWVTINMKGFAALIDAIGGIDFYIPVNMNYNDPYQNLHINYTRGMQRGLTGKQALEIIRYRGYASRDIERINTQQLLLTAAVEQILAKKSSMNVTSMAGIFLNNVRTDIPLNSLIWFGLRFLELEPENVHFAQMPGNNVDFVGNQGYVTIYLDQWLEMLNSRLNPFANDKTPEDLSILTRGEDRKLYVTDGNWAGDPTWGSGSRGPNPSTSGGSGAGSSASSGSGSSGSSSPSSGSGSNSNSSSSGSGLNDDPDADSPDSDIEPPDDPAESEDPQESEPFEFSDRQQPDPPYEDPAPNADSPPISNDTPDQDEP